MTDRAALVELLARVEKGDLWGGSLAHHDDALALVHRALPDSDAQPNAFVWAYNGGVDGAIALVEYLLPGAWFRLAGPWVGKWEAMVYAHPDDLGLDDFSVATHPTNPARALLIATLKAKLATMGDAP